MFRRARTRSAASDFYQIRRAGIRDFFGVLGFLVGFIGFGPYGWPMLQDGVASGDMAQGLFRFFGVVLAGGLVVGAAGLMVGVLAGFAWEAAHRAIRPPRSPDVPATPGAGPDAMPGRTPDLAWAIQYGTRPLTADAYADLGRNAAQGDRVEATTTGIDATSRALNLTENFTAWRDDALVGVLRIFTDGLTATVVDIMVRPDHRHLGIARELMRRALDSAPNGEIRLAPQGQLLRFFQSLGPAREPSRLVLRSRDFPPDHR